MYLNTPQDKLIFYDIEADGLQPTKVWCVVAKKASTQQVWKLLDYPDIRKFFHEQIKEGSIFVAHNNVSYDRPVLARLVGVDIPFDQTVDTLVLSHLYNPALAGGHSLEAYGERLKFPKGKHTDWDKFSPEMLEYCERDVGLLEQVYNNLTQRMRKIGFSELSCEIEHKTRELIDRQQQHGFYFDRLGAESLLQHLRQRETDLAVPIRELFPPKLEALGTYSRRKRQDGGDYASYTKHLAKYPKVTYSSDNTYTCWDYFDFNIASVDQRLERLLEVGFEPKSFTAKGNPKVDEEALLAFAKECGREEVSLMASWLVHNGRANMVQTWLNNVGPDSRIHGKVMTCGATTRRMTHSSPNTANIPSAKKAQYGKECRSLWSVEPGRGLVLVGADASSLETIGLLHYLGNKKAEAALNGPVSVHDMNAEYLTKALKRPVDREWGAKTSWYAWLYGAYPKKLGQIVKGPPSDGDIVIEAFYKNVPGLDRLIREVHEEWHGNKGLLRTIDGGYVRCPSLNASLNYRIQSLGALVMKLGAIILRNLTYVSGVEYETVGTIHDEWQMEVHKNDAEQLGKLAVQSMTQAAEQLNFKVPLTGDYKIGSSWAETH